MVRNAEALGGKNVSHDAVKKVSFQSLFKSCQGVQVDDIVRQRVPNGRCSDRKSTAGKNCSSSSNCDQPRCVIERKRVVRAVTEGTLVSMSILR